MQCAVGFSCTLLLIQTLFMLLTLACAGAVVLGLCLHKQEKACIVACPVQDSTSKVQKEVALSYNKLYISIF